MSWLSISVLILMACVIITTFILYKTGAEKNVPYFNTFELHYTVAVLGLLTIVLLGDLNLLDKGNVATLFSSLIAYVLGASSTKLLNNNSSSDAPLKLSGGDSGGDRGSGGAAAGGGGAGGSSSTVAGGSAGNGTTASGSTSVNSTSTQIPV